MENPAFHHSGRFRHHRRILWGAVAVIALLGLTRAAHVVDAGENHAFLVAVADYDEKELRPLKFTRSDILDFQSTLQTSGFKPENVVLMHDDLEKLVAHYRQRGPEYKPADYLPEREKIRTELQLMLGTLRPDDSVIVAFAGHGVQFAGKKQSYFCPKDARLDNVESLISFEEIYETLAQSRAGRKMLLVDACQNDPQTALSRSRSTVDLNSVTRIQEETVPEGIVALFSCRAGQKSFEHPPLGHGIFFYHLLEGWKGKADGDGNGKLSYHELADYTEKETARYAKVNLKALQVPSLRSDFSGEWVLREYSAAKAITNSIGMKLVLLRGGDFVMGKPGATENDFLPHLVRISKPFYIGAHEVTVGQFRAFIEDQKYDPGTGVGYNAQTLRLEFQNPNYSWRNPGWAQTDNHPVINVSWNVAKDFCRWLSSKEGKRYRLPTEAEWEYACRGGTTTNFFFGDSEDDLKGRANISDSQYKLAFAPSFRPGGAYADGDYTKPWVDGFAFTAPVGSFAPNPFGLYDMHGNVQEWVADWYGENYFLTSPSNVAIVDPTGPATGTFPMKHGGDWLDYAVICQSWFRRAEVPPNNRAHFIGFRVARDGD